MAGGVGGNSPSPVFRWPMSSGTCLRVSMAGASIVVDVDATFDRSNWCSSRSKMTELLFLAMAKAENWCGGEGAGRGYNRSGPGRARASSTHTWLWRGREGGRVASAGTADLPCLGWGREKRLEG